MNTRKVVVVLLILAIVFSAITLVADLTGGFHFVPAGQVPQGGGVISINILDNGANSVILGALL